MNKNKYIETIEKITISEEFENNIINRLKVSLENKDNINRKKIKYNYRAIGALAASIAILVTVGFNINSFMSLRNNIDNEPNNSIALDQDKYLDKDYLAALPKIDPSASFGGMGFAAYRAYNIGDIKDSNPWTINSHLKVMPVIKNKDYTREVNGVGAGSLTGDDMLTRAKEIASKLKINIKEESIAPTKEYIEALEKKTGRELPEVDKKPSYAIVSGDGINIKVEATGKTVISFTEEKQVPAKYSFTYYKTSGKDAEDTIKYLLKEYESILNLKSPMIEVSEPYYTGYGLYNPQEYNVFEGYGTLVDKILNYNLNKISFAPSNSGGYLSSIYIENTDISDVIGYYPIINHENAKQKLLDGHYISSGRQDIINEEFVKRVSLVYRNSIRDEVLMPYYEFLVEIPSMKQDDGLNTYGIYYVPAVEDEYLTTLPKATIQIN